MPDLVTLAEIETARDRIASVALTTPVLPTTSLATLAGRPVWLKAENLQRTGSFKIRGALNALSQLEDAQKQAGVVAGSAGNHAQGVALAAAELGFPCTIFMPEAAALPKVEATKGYGATVVLHGSHLGEAVDAALSHAAETGAKFIHPYDDRAIIAGQGTLGLELMEQLPNGPPPTIVIPIGGGGLISGSAAAIKALRPDATVVGVQSAAVAAYAASREAGHPVTVPAMPTVADGIAVVRPSELAFACIEAFVDDIVTVEDTAAKASVALLLERAKLLVEPSGAVPLAALLSRSVAGEGPVVLVLSGGNIDPQLLGGLLRDGLEARGRFAALVVRVPDLPGQLAGLLTTVADAGGNILSVDHRREGTGLPYGVVEIALSMQTRSADHAARIVSALEATGVEVM